MEELIKHLRYRIILHETVGDYEISTETLKIILDEWESKALSQHDVMKSVCVCDFAIKDEHGRYDVCIKCGAKYPR